VRLNRIIHSLQIIKLGVPVVFALPVNEARQ
jgi:hypothetical protein